MFNPFDTNAHVWQPIFNPFNFLHDVYASEDVSFGSSYDLVRYQQDHPAIDYAYVYLADGTKSDRFNYSNSHTKLFIPMGAILTQIFADKFSN